MSLPSLSAAPATSDFDEEKAIPVLSRWIGSWQLSLHRKALSSQELRTAYDCEAPGWGRTLQFLHMQSAYSRALQNILHCEGITAFPFPRPCRVLDCGVGDGAFSTALGEITPAPVIVDAVDLSPQMLALANRRFDDFSIPVDLHHADVRRLPFGDDEFDIGLTAHMLEHLPDPQAALCEMTRVLKPGGLLVACITRQSILGRYIQAKWRTHAVTRKQAETWLRVAGLQDVYSLSSIGHDAFDRMSIVCAGRKPFKTR